MKPREFSASLTEFAQLLRAAGCDRAATEFQDVAKIFELSDAKTLAATVKTIQKYWKAAGRQEAHPASLKSLLPHAASLLKASKAPAPAKDYDALLSLFTGRDSGDAAAFCADLREAIITPPPKPAKARKKTRALDVLEVRRVADRLTGLLYDNAGFDAAVAELEAPRKHSIKELKAIAEQFLGYEGGHKTKADIIEAIRNRQLQEAIGASKDRRIEKIAV